MMSDQDIEPTIPSTQPDIQDELTVLLNGIVNAEGNPKYATPVEALKGAAHAQHHISALEADNAKLKEERSKMEELLNQLSQQGKEPPATTGVQAIPAESNAEWSVDSLFEQFTQRLTAKQQAKQAEANKRKAIEQSKAAFGEKTEEVLRSKAAAYGMSVQELLNEAATRPQLFNTIVGINSKSTTQPSFTTSSVNTAALNSAPNQRQGKNPLLTGKTKDAMDLWNSL